MSNEICIIHHLGLGDQLMLNGMVRYFLQFYKINLIVNKAHEENVTFMYKDCDKHKLNLIFIESNHPKNVWENTKDKGRVVPLATYGVDDNMWKFMTQGQGSLFSNWVHGVYIQAGVNPVYMTSKFKVERDDQKESTLYNKYITDDEDYIFIHDSGSVKNSQININTKLKIIRPQSEDTNIFDYLKIIENAQEVHCINSVFAWMIELVKVGNSKNNFFHTGLAHTYYNSRSVRTVFSDDRWTFID